MTVTYTEFLPSISPLNSARSCEIRTSANTRCAAPARYYAICHDCTHGAVCADHLDTFLSQVGSGEVVECNRCGRLFDCIEAAVTVVEL